MEEQSLGFTGSRSAALWNGPPCPNPLYQRSRQLALVPLSALGVQAHTQLLGCLLLLLILPASDYLRLVSICQPPAFQALIFGTCLLLQSKPLVSKLTKTYLSDVQVCGRLACCLRGVTWSWYYYVPTALFDPDIDGIALHAAHQE